MDRPYLANAGPDADVIFVLHSLCFHEPLKEKEGQYKPCLATIGALPSWVGALKMGDQLALSSAVL